MVGLRLKTCLLLPLFGLLVACDAADKERPNSASTPSPTASEHDVTGYYYNSADVLTYLHPVRMFEEREVYTRSEGSLEVAHADTYNLVVTLHPLVLADDRAEVQQELVDQALLYGILKVFTHTKVEWLDIQVTPRLAAPVSSEKAYEVVYLPEPRRHVALSRAQAQAFLRAHTSARSFSDLVDTDKQWRHLRGADSLLYTQLYYTPGRPSQLALLLSKQYAPK